MQKDHTSSIPVEEKHRIIQLAASGQLVGARDLCAGFCDTYPEDGDAWFLLGAVYGQLGDLTQAEKCLRRALDLGVRNADLLRNLGNVLLRQGQHDAASKLLLEALQLSPDAPEILFDLGNALQASGKHHEAEIIYRQIIASFPGNADVRLNLALSLKSQNDFAGAVTSCQQVLELQPDRCEAHTILAETLNALGDDKAAAIHLEHICRLTPDSAASWARFGMKKQLLGEIKTARDCYKKAVALDPQLPEARVLNAMMLLLEGDFEEGWREYEWRWKWRKRQPRNFSQPLWDGSDLTGRTILLHPEQGYGDSIQFLRYVPLVKARGGIVIVETHAPLHSLFSTFADIDTLTITGQPLPAFDTHAPLMSLPAILGASQATIPAKIPYLSPTRTDNPELMELLQRKDDNLNVGIVWAGGPKAKNDMLRSCPSQHFRTLLKVPGVTFFSLQKGTDARELGPSHGPGTVVDLNDMLHDFLDTAIAISNMDLVISVDTAVPHLAGALGKPVWILLPAAPDWRWMLEREDSPWYPTARLFRQQRLRDWPELLERVSVALSEKAASGKASTGKS